MIYNWHSYYAILIPVYDIIMIVLLYIHLNTSNIEDSLFFILFHIAFKIIGIFSGGAKIAECINTLWIPVIHNRAESFWSRSISWFPVQATTNCAIKYMTFPQGPKSDLCLSHMQIYANFYQACEGFLGSFNGTLVHLSTLWFFKSKIKKKLCIQFYSSFI